MMIIYKEFSFDAAHFLPNVPEGHKCRRLHGHTYLLKVCVAGEAKAHEQWVMDYGDLKAVVKPVVDELDHKYLNDIKGLENPTAEKVIFWIWQRLKPALPQLKRIELKETPGSGVIYEE
ncbi:6-carboxytetrahydropterin synthase QueD [Terrimonas sp. NA20]|uniref:6-carboxy-5,6,7,8-tetrahydropterin synthase n=1 Tax=Terrimonas ginsenosidimutans TaxID=2908004 RepID=A0ABS9KM46_9BACT|nr:6-carboxytetrahydropterin synthase QueD [Terrimonas ginsenosidimutans]MCG2613392.1 6-carboxytetrahydropterin synthase QueD [Terrimonas ginsenosidimutans]